MKKRKASRFGTAKKQNVKTRKNNQNSSKRRRLEFAGSISLSYLLTVYQDQIAELHHRLIAAIIDFLS
jgi:hypothetical protein